MELGEKKFEYLHALSFLLVHTTWYQLIIIGGNIHSIHSRVIGRKDQLFLWISNRYHVVICECIYPRDAAQMIANCLIIIFWYFLIGSLDALMNYWSAVALHIHLQFSKLLINSGFLFNFLTHQERALHYVNDVNGDIQIGEGINLVQTEQVPTGGRQLTDIELSENVEARESQVDSLLADRVARFLGTHTLQFKVPKDSIEEMQRSLEEGKPYNSIEKLLWNSCIIGSCNTTVIHIHIHKKKRKERSDTHLKTYQSEKRPLFLL